MGAHEIRDSRLTKESSASRVKRSEEREGGIRKHVSMQADVEDTWIAGSAYVFTFGQTVYPDHYS